MGGAWVMGCEPPPGCLIIPTLMKKRVGTRPEEGLTRERIVAAALQEIDGHGLANFSIRNLASKLGVYPTAIYWHIPNRNQILAEVVGQILAGANPGDSLEWRGFLRQLFSRYRNAIKKHPQVAPLVGAHLIGNSSIPFSFVERLLRKLEEAGFAAEELVHAYNSVIAALAGFITQEFSAVPQDDDGAWQERVRERLRSVDSRECPTLAANLPLLENHAFVLRWQSGAEEPLDASFARYVEIEIGGLERLAAAVGTKKKGRD
jgi:AcrR family transcriptional regulator